MMGNGNNGNGKRDIAQDLEGLDEPLLRAKLAEVQASASQTDEEIEKLDEAIELLNERLDRVKKRLEVATTH
jgi:peptidoglycan hydrolase CwlO-like protein